MEEYWEKEITGVITHRRIMGKHIAFLTLLDKEKQFVFKKEIVKDNFPSKSGLPLKKKIFISAVEDGNEFVVCNWRLIDEDSSLSSSDINDGLKKHDILCTPWSLGKTCDELKCKYRHFYISEDEETHAIRRRDLRNQYIERDNQLKEEYHQNDPFKEKNFKQKRSEIFVSWLIQTFSKETLNTGSGVVDIAGGAGKNAIVLLKNDILCTVIDPKVRRKQKLMEKKGNLPYNQIIECFSEDSVISNEIQNSLIKSSSCLIGLHPDQPTVDIVKVALKFNKPFAIVPCCVFSSLYPNRRLPNGNTLKTTEDLCQYILSLNSSIQISFLPFQGRNKILYYFP